MVRPEPNRPTEARSVGTGPALRAALLALVDDEPRVAEQCGAVKDDQGVGGDAAEGGAADPLERAGGLEDRVDPQRADLAGGVGEQTELVAVLAQDEDAGLL